MEITIPTQIGKYSLGQKIGNGTYSQVFGAINTETHESLAIKVINRSLLQKQNQIIQFQREINILLSLYHSNIVQVYEVLDDCNFIYICMELCQGQSLLKLINQTHGIEEEISKLIFKQLILVLDYIHSIGVYHRDIKPENIIVDYKYNIKLIDFGFSILAKPGTLLQTFCGSLQYLAPECLLKNPYYGGSSDIWSSGVVFYSMLTATHPWSSNSIPGIIHQITNCEYIIPTKISHGALAIIKSILVLDPKNRPTANELLTNTYFNDLPTLKQSNSQIRKESRFFSYHSSIRKWDSDQKKSSFLLNPLQNKCSSLKSSDFKQNQIKVTELDQLPNYKKRRRSTAIYVNAPPVTSSPTFVIDQ